MCGICNVTLEFNTFKDHLGLSSSLFVFNNNIKYYASAVYSEGINEVNNPYGLEIKYTNVFENNERHVTAFNGVNLNILGPSFSTSKRKAIEWSNNKACSLSIVGCSFTNCAINAIRCDYNAYPSTLIPGSYVLIDANTFQNTLYNLSSTIGSNFNNYAGNAINLIELAKTSITGYQSIKIRSNIIKNLRGGISIIGLTGGKNKNLQTKPSNDPKIFDIQENSIFLRTSLNSLDGDGIQIINSSRLAVYDQRYIDGIKVLNTPPTNTKTRNAIYLENNAHISIKPELTQRKFRFKSKVFKHLFRCFVQYI